VPADAYVWLGSCSVLVPPSPNVHEYVYEPEPPAAAPVKETLSGAVPDAGVPLAEAVREEGALTTIPVDAVAVTSCPRLSSTVRVT
jgi:hypothetical protein